MKMKVKLNTLLAFLACAILLSTSGKNSNYWPIKLKKELSGTLGEIRGHSFHSGIDIRTGGRNGYPVISYLDGKIMRLISKEFGYGNCLFIGERTNTKGNNLVSVYGHMDSFENDSYKLYSVSEIIKQLLNSNNIDISLTSSNIAVEGNKNIGYTGETGSGNPHLHFELRSGGEFLNPLAQLDVEDNDSPVIEKIYICNEIDGTTVLEKEFLVKKGFTGYKLESNTIEFENTGKVFIKVSCFDNISARNRVAVYKLILHEDGNKIFELVFDKLKSSDFQYAPYVYDISKSTINGNVLYTYSLCKREGNEFSGITSLNDGYLNSNKEKNITIETLDFAKNSCKIKFKMRAAEPAKIKIYEPPNAFNKNPNYLITDDSKSFSINVSRQTMANGRYLQVKQIDYPVIKNNIINEFFIKENNFICGYAVYPFDLFYRKPFQITIKRPSAVLKSEVKNIFIYQFFSETKPRLLETSYNANTDSFTANSPDNGYFALLRDGQSPVFYMPPTHELIHDRDIYRYLRVYTYDHLSDINGSSISCLVDGEIFPARFDFDRKWVEAELPKSNFSKGTHHIFIKLKDKAGNEAVFKNIVCF